MKKRKQQQQVEPIWDVKQWVREFEQLDRSKSVREKFRDFCEMAYLAYAKPFVLDKDRQEAMEDRYMKIVGTYQDKDTVRAYPKFIGEVWRNLKGGGDFLGNVAQELNALNADQGQFFTPYAVCRLLAQISLGDLDAIKKHPGYFTMYEPCVGSGAIVLAMADAVEYAGHKLATTMLCYAGDVSQLAFHMCYIQLTLRGIPAFVARENALSLEHFEGAWTPAAFDFLAYHGHLFKKPENHEEMTDVALMTDLLNQMLDIINEPAQQTSFFDLMNTNE